MTVTTTILVFVIAWFIVLQAVLPWGVRRAENVETGNDPGAPTRPRMRLKLAVTTVLALILSALIFGAVEADLFSFREMVQGIE